MLKIEGLSYTYPGGIQALKNIQFKVPPREIFSIMGRSGSGKTTLLKCIVKFLKPDQGRIELHGQDIFAMEERRFRQSVGIVFQNLYLFPHLNVIENMTLAPIQVLKKSKRQAEEEARAILKRLGIETIWQSYPSQISGGQAQRVAIARALILKPQYLLLDEPTSALDVDTTDEFGRWLLALKAETTFVIVTHDVTFAGNIATSGVLMADGEIKARGNAREIGKPQEREVTEDEHEK
jgi:polar amino acid transport system ATP-binding protein